ncbi:MAG: 4Fe-4S binding protein, partial [Candidatus Onthovivens sp.]|nr:4Fe-4S binding protein [Candidatus Onthovivens sp.]
GALIGGESPHQVDAVGAALIGLSPDEVTTLRAAKQRGLLAPYACVGDPIEPLILHDFDIPMRAKRRGWVNMVNRLPQALRPRPVFTHRRCDGCGTCVRACPAKAIKMDEHRRPQVDLTRCIRCYCCQELCPKTDVEVRRNPLVSLLHERGKQ